MYLTMDDDTFIEVFFFLEIHLLKLAMHYIISYILSYCKFSFKEKLL